jgi:hypothetical protein
MVVSHRIARSDGFETSAELGPIGAPGAGASVYADALDYSRRPFTPE